MTQVVPDYHSQARGVAEYREAIRAYDGGNLTFTSLEGYVVARLFTTAVLTASARSLAPFDSPPELMRPARPM